jgi:DNA-binding Lrp family transcriptional regulator
MIHKRDQKILTHLRRNGRETLTIISKKTHIPISTIYDRLKTHENSLIKKFTPIIDFNQLGYKTRVHIAFKTNQYKRDELKEFLNNNPNVNCLFKINNDFDFLIEGVFTDIKHLEKFISSVEDKFELRDSKIFHIVEDVKRESFLTNPDLLSYYFN